MNAQTGLGWLAYATRQQPDVLAELGFTEEQLTQLGLWLSQNKLLNPPRSNKVHVGEFVCKCGCGERFTAEYVNKRPQFKDSAHRMRYWRAKWRAEGENQQ